MVHVSVQKGIFWLILTGILGLCIACDWRARQPAKKYSLLIMSKDQKQYIYQTDSLHSGTVNPIEQGALLDHPARIWYYMLVRDGYYYYVDQKSEYFVKGQLRNHEFVRLDSVRLPGFGYADNAAFLDRDTIFFINHSVGLKPKRYAKVDVHTLGFIADDLPLPTPKPPFDNMSVGFEFWKASKLYLGYTYHFHNADLGYGSSDTVYLARLSYPEMKLEHLDKDSRSTYPGNVNTAQNNTFQDEKADFYFLSCPGIVRGANPDQPTAIYRIKASESQLDTSYFFNISASPIQNHAYGLWYLGGSKALIRSERKDLFKNYKEHYLVPHIEYYQIDLQTRQVHRLDLPLDRGSSRTCVLVEGDQAFITINDGKGNNDVWVYSWKNQSLKKGLHLTGEVDYIFRLDRVNE